MCNTANASRRWRWDWKSCGCCLLKIILLEMVGQYPIRTERRGQHFVNSIACCYLSFFTRHRSYFRRTPSKRRNRRRKNGTLHENNLPSMSKFKLILIKQYFWVDNNSRSIRMPSSRKRNSIPLKTELFCDIRCINDEWWWHIIASGLNSPGIPATCLCMCV